MTDRHETPARLCILHLEDSEQDHWLVKRELGKLHEALDLQRVETLDGFADALNRQAFQLVLADYRLAGFTALDAWTLMQKNGGARPVCAAFRSNRRDSCR
jgi:DNA-binding NtrC family response regulator